LKILALLKLIILSSYSIADTTVPYDHIRTLHVYSNSGHVYFGHKAHDCSDGGYILPKSHVSFDVIVSFLLASEMSNKRVQLRIDGCNSNNQGVVTGVYIEN